ncbi:MAG: glycosyltransferase [Pseudomonadota bacterium]
MSDPELSVLIPFYNEEGNVLPLLEEVHQALEGIAFEIVCVNDCSADQTATELAEARLKWPATVSVFTHTISKAMPSSA